MLIQCNHRKPERDHRTRQWTEAPPFNVNPRGMLAHRVRAVSTHTLCGGSHESVEYWCGNITSGAGVSLADDPGERLLCARCEEAALAAGEQPVDLLCERHVHLGELRPHRLCCRGELEQS